MYKVWSSNTEDLAHLGMAFPMYFYLMKRLIQWAVFLSLFHGLPFLAQTVTIFFKFSATTVNERDALSGVAPYSFYPILSLRIKYGFDYAVWIYYCYFILFLAFLTITLFVVNDMKTRIKEKEEEISTIKTPAKYCIMASYVPRDAT